MNNLTSNYDGTEKSITINGDLPEGANILYSNNVSTNAGTHNATATISLANYNTLILNAVLTINKIDITDITFSDGTFTYDGNEKLITISGILPNGVEVNYTTNKATETGTYNATAVLSGMNYNSLTLNAVLKINPNLSQMATNIINSVLVLPDPWSFLPEAFALENKVYTGSTSLDFNTNFVNAYSIPQLGMGKQMNVVYDTMLNAEEILGYLNAFYGAANVVVNFYQEFINENPDNYASYEKNTEDFNFKITLTDTTSLILINYSSVAIELSYDETTNRCYGRIQLSDSNSVKYEMGEDYLKMAVNIMGLSLSQIEFVRDEDEVLGYLYEFLGTSETNIKTSALIKIDDNYTTIISNKRETDDLVIEGNEELYDNTTGNFVGAEVKETVSSVQYDTMWFNLYNISGITSIRKEDVTNGVNLDTIYVNNSLNSFVAKKVGGFSLKTLSRRFDIEMKVMYFYTYDNETQNYTKNSIEIPMMFIQREYMSSFGLDAYTSNSNNGVTANLEITLTSDELLAINDNYTNLLDLYTTIKANIAYQDIINYIGTKNSYFE
ncbi:MAG: hypothetical protein PHO33_04610 [Clostridia bacterium]|nr:hypothetical protein [Clostridia bacterium]